MANCYKPRYKHILRTKSKIWAYKNSRLKGFYDLRGVVTFRKGFWHRRHLKFKSAKWFQARRFILPQQNQRLRRSAKYQEAILDLKRIRMFYGKFDAYKFKMLFFRAYQDVCFNRIQNFLYHLEQRSDIVLFRLKFLPTIFACHNFIKNHGILINNKQINYPHTLVKIGDIISVSKDIWWHFYYIFERKIFSRLIRTFSLHKRRKKLFKKLKSHFKTFKKKQRYSKKLFWLPQTQIGFENKKPRWFFYKNLMLSRLKNQLKFKEVFEHGIKLKKRILKYKLKKLKLFKSLSKIKQKLLKLNQMITILDNKFLHYVFLQLYFQLKKIEHKLFFNQFTTRTKKTKNLIFRQYLNKALLSIFVKWSKSNNETKLSSNQIQQFFNLILQNSKFLKELIFSLKKNLKISKIFTIKKQLNMNLFNSIINIPEQNNSIIQNKLKERLFTLLIPIINSYTESTNSLNSFYKDVNKVVLVEMKKKLNQSSKKFIFQKNLLNKIFKKPWQKKPVHWIKSHYKKKVNVKDSNNLQLRENLQSSFFNTFPFHLMKKWLQNKNLIFLVHLLYNQKHKKNSNKIFNVNDFFWLLHNNSSDDQIHRVFYKITNKTPYMFYFFFNQFYKNHSKNIQNKKKTQIFFENIYIKKGWKVQIQSNFRLFSLERFNQWAQNKINSFNFWYNIYDNYQMIEYEKRSMNLKKKPSNSKNLVSHQYYLNIVQDYFTIKKQIFYLNYTIQYLTLNLMLKYNRVHFNNYLRSLNTRFNKHKHLILINPKNTTPVQIKNSIFKNVENFIDYIKNWDRKMNNWINPFIWKFYEFIESLIQKKERSLNTTELNLDFFNKLISNLFNHFTNFVFLELQKNVSKKKYELIKILSQHNLFINNILNQHNINRYARKYFLKKRFYQYLYTNENISITLGKKQTKQVQISPSKSYQNPQLKRNILRKTWWHRFKQDQKGFLQQHHWFIPKYMEFDFKTLRGGIIREPALNEIIYPFNFSIKRILMHYKDRGY